MHLVQNVDLFVNSLQQLQLCLRPFEGRIILLFVCKFQFLLFSISGLNTLIGIKHLSPDPVWPRPRDKKNKMVPPKFKVDSFVSDEHKELLRLAAQ